MNRPLIRYKIHDISCSYILYPEPPLTLVVGFVHDVRHIHNSIKNAQSLVLWIDKELNGGDGYGRSLS